MRNSTQANNRQYRTVARAIEFIRSNARRQPTLTEVAAAVDLSEHHLQRVFSEWAGLSPKRFLQYLTKEHARRALLQSKDILSTTLETGLSSPGRLHDLMVSCEAMSPGEIRQHGRGLEIRYGTAASPFGQALVGWTSRGICRLSFCDDDCTSAIEALSSEWITATLQRDDKGAERLLDRIFSFEAKTEKLHLLLRGTNFQIKVWEALLGIGSSTIISYSMLAELSGSPRAQRAVGTAMAANPIAYLIPCHRVIREDGSLGIYRWGSERKAAMQAWEAANSTR